MKIFFFCFCLNFLLWFDFLKYFFPLLWCFWLLVLWIYYHHRWLWGNTHHFRQKKQLFSIQNRWVFFSFSLFLIISWLVDAMCSILYIRKNKYELLTENFLMEYQEKWNTKWNKNKERKTETDKNVKELFQVSQACAVNKFPGHAIGHSIENYIHLLKTKWNI